MFLRNSSIFRQLDVKCSFEEVQARNSLLPSRQNTQEVLFGNLSAYVNFN